MRTRFSPNFEPVYLLRSRATLWLRGSVILDESVEGTTQPARVGNLVQIFQQYGEQIIVPQPVFLV